MAGFVTMPQPLNLVPFGQLDTRCGQAMSITQYNYKKPGLSPGFLRNHRLKIYSSSMLAS